MCSGRRQTLSDRGQEQVTAHRVYFSRRLCLQPGSPQSKQRKCHTVLPVRGGGIRHPPWTQECLRPPAGCDLCKPEPTGLPRRKSLGHNISVPPLLGLRSAVRSQGQQPSGFVHSLRAECLQQPPKVGEVGGGVCVWVIVSLFVFKMVNEVH